MEMSCELNECWDDWEKEAKKPEPDQGSPAVTYSKRFVPRLSARRSNVAVAADSEVWWSVLQTLEEWKDEQTKMFRVYIVLTTVMFVSLMVRIHSLERSLARARS